MLLPTGFGEASALFREKNRSIGLGNDVPGFHQSLERFADRDLADAELAGELNGTRLSALADQVVDQLTVVCRRFLDVVVSGSSKTVNGMVGLAQWVARSLNYAKSGMAHPLGFRVFMPISGLGQ